MRIVVTGATSMIGVALIKEAVKNNCQVLAIVRKGTKRIERLPKTDLITIVYGELETLEQIDVSEKTWDVFYHFAWMHTEKENRDNPLSQTENIVYTLQAVLLAKKLGCKKFIGAGSQAEYGNVKGQITEFTVPNPNTAYGMAKLSSNLLSRKLCEQLEILHIWGRIFSVYGSNDNAGTMLKYAIEQFGKGEKASFSAATQMWDYLYEDDAGKMFYLLGEMDVQTGNYCIANGNPRPIREFIQIVHQIVNPNAEIEFSTEKMSNVYGIEPDISCLTGAISYVPETSFEDGIKKIVL